MYNKKQWESNELITKEALNNIENGIANKPDFTQYQDYTIINVKEHGAVGDGIANDAPALKEIFSNVEDYSVIYFPAGTYLMGNGDDNEIILKLSQKKYVNIIGHSKDDTKIVAHPDSPVKNRMGLLHLFRTEYCRVENLEFDGNSQLRHIVFGGTNWGDNGTVVDDCSNINVDGANYTVIRNVYSHHPIIDCIITSRYAGGETAANHHLLIEDCILDYGYRQGLSICGTDHGILRNCRITNTSMAPNLYLNDGTSVIGTSPRAGIDSETWAWNHDWLIEGCYFENNLGGHINMNDGASEHVIRKNYFVGGFGIGCETPSAGTRTLNNIITQNHFINSTMGSLHGAFIITDNTFYWDDTSKTDVAIVRLSLNDTSFKRTGEIIFSNNRISVRLDLFTAAGIDLSTLKFAVSFGIHVKATNNSFHNLTSSAIIHMANARNLVFTNNEITADVDLRSLETKIVSPTTGIINNNYVDDNYPVEVKNAYNQVQNNIKLNKDGNSYSKNMTMKLYNNRKYLFDIVDSEKIGALYAKVTIISPRTNVTQSMRLDKPAVLEYEILCYINNSNAITQQVNFKNVFDSDIHLITCTGFEVIDNKLKLGIANEYVSGYVEASISIELRDINNNMMDSLNLGTSTYESITSPYPVTLTTGDYAVGDIVRSMSSGGGVYIYEVTTGGTIVEQSPKLYNGRDYTVEGVTFTYKGVYKGQFQFGQDEN